MGASEEFTGRVAFGFLGGTILSVPGGYRVLQHPRPERVFDRLGDARWFLAVQWCDHCPTPAGILNHEGAIAFHNQPALALGETQFLPPPHRLPIFQTCTTLAPGEVALYRLSPTWVVDVLGLELDARYGRVALIRHHLPARPEGDPEARL